MRGDVAVALVPVVLAWGLVSAGCSDGEVSASASAAGTGGAGGNGSGNGGESAGDGGSTASDGGATSSPAAGPSTGPGGTTSGGTSGSSTSTATATVVASTSVTGGGEDEYAEEREICVAKINELRATEGLPAYGRWGDAEQCSDDAVTSDEQSGTAHGAFGMCGESAQNECLGHGPAGVAACLEQMWAEKDQEGCAGCILCHDSPGNCPNCDFLGTETGQPCGHYVNMSARYFSEVACGFSSLGGWDVQNFR